MPEIITESWYQQLIDDCRSIIVESTFASRWALIEGYHQLGKRLLEDEDKYPNILELIQHVGQTIGKSKSTLYYAVQFARKFPELELLPEGKNLTWRDVVHKYLPKPKEAEELVEQVLVPEGKYQTIIIDPPWPIEKILRDVRPNQDVFEYPTMTIEEIKAFPIDKFAADNCHIYMWFTHKFLHDALHIMETWGAKYECQLTWVKNVGFTPYSWMYSTEHVLFSRKGNLELLKKGKRLDFSAKVRQHSRKPDEFYNLVREVSPEPRIDIFSREKREGFSQYGNETTHF